MIVRLKWNKTVDLFEQLDDQSEYDCFYMFLWHSYRLIPISSHTYRIPDVVREQLSLWNTFITNQEPRVPIASWDHQNMEVNILSPSTKFHLDFRKDSVYRRSIISYYILIHSFPLCIWERIIAPFPFEMKIFVCWRQKPGAGPDARRPVRFSNSDGDWLTAELKHYEVLESWDNFISSDISYHFED